MKKKYILILLALPLLVMLELGAFSLIAELLRTPSDIAVITGVACLTADLLLNYFLCKKLTNNFGNPKKDSIFVP